MTTQTSLFTPPPEAHRNPSLTNFSTKVYRDMGSGGKTADAQRDGENQSHLHFPGEDWAPEWLENQKIESTQLWPIQQRAFDLLRHSLMSGHKRVMLQFPTGGGKTILSAHIIKSALQRGKRIIFVVDAIQLINQTVRKLWRDGIRAVGVMQADHEMTDSTREVQVCSVQTLSRRQIPPADIVIIDEAHIHYAFYSEWMSMLDWRHIPFIGLSATPYSKGLGKYYTSLVKPTSTEELIQKKLLVPYFGKQPSDVDVSKVKMVADDYHRGQLGEVFNRPQLIADAVETWLAFSEDRPTLCYGVNRAHAKNLQTAFNRVGIPTGYMDQYTKTEERREIRKKSESGEYKVVSNVMVLVKGVDWPWISCLDINFKTKDQKKLQQVIGRGLRIHPGKKDCLILDHGGSTNMLGGPIQIERDFVCLDMGDRKARKKVMAKPKEEVLAKKCPACGKYKEPGVHKCPDPECGFEPEKQAGVKYTDDQLVDMGKEKRGPTLEEKKKFFAELKYIYINKYKDKYRPGWPAGNFKNKYKHWPNGMDNLEPREPTQKTLNWVKSQQIRYAKRRKK